MNTGARIREYRKRKGLTIKELAEKVGLSEQAISQYERSARKVNFETLLKISSILGVDISILSSKIPYPPPLDEIKNNPESVFRFTLEKSFDEDVRPQVRLVWKILNEFNYTIECHEDMVFIMDTIKDDTHAEICKHDFLEICNVIYWFTKGFIFNLKTNTLNK